MLRVTDVDGKTTEYNLQRYTGQDYDPHEWALTVAVIEDTTEVYLVPLNPPHGRLMIEELHRYLEATQAVWTKTHTIYRRVFADYVNKKR